MKWWVLLAALTMAGSASAARHALVIGTNQGFSDEPVLQFAESDARLFARTLIEVAGVPAANVRVVTGARLEEVRAAVREAGRGLSESDEWILYVSGHADAAGAHVRGHLWPWADIRAALDEARPRLAVAFVDACFSGALLTAKGLTLGPPMQVEVQPTVEGRLIFTSSGANELSFESVKLQGSPFTHFVVGGLRGAADANLDAKVTASELYAFLYSRTIAASLGAGSGPQRPRQELRIEGAGDWALSELSRQGTFVRAGRSEFGSCYLLDADETHVLAELVGAPVLVPAGSYRVKCVNAEEVLAATLHATQREQGIDSLTFEPVPITRALTRGPVERRTHRFTLTAGGKLEQSQVRPAFAIRYALAGKSFTPELVAAYSFDRQLQLSIGLGTALPWWNLGSTRLELGLLAGAARSWAPDSFGTSLLAGGYTQLELPVIEAAHVTLRLQIATRIPLTSEQSSLAPITFVLGLGFDP
jgi:hypothetical protein